MPENHTRNLFVNVAVTDLKRSMDFFEQLGFTFNRQFTNDDAACMVVNNGAYFMLLTGKFFHTFTKNQICDTTSQTEGMFALSCGSRAEVDALVHKAVAAGGRHAMPPLDHGYMYGWSFYDPDGHHWEAFWMDPKMIAHQ